MKKIILILTVLTVLLFTGCDDMLEVFYPEFADDYNDTNNVITVRYDISPAVLASIFNSSVPVKMEVYISGDSPVYGDKPFSSFMVYDSKESYSFDFWVPENQYDIWIWQDDNANGIIDNGEFVLFADTTTVPTFYVSALGDPQEYIGNSWVEWGI